MSRPNARPPFKRRLLYIAMILVGAVMTSFALPLAGVGSLDVLYRCPGDQCFDTILTTAGSAVMALVGAVGFVWGILLYRRG